MPTPPQSMRTTLPSSSPSSARLRRIAPSPVFIPPPPKSIASPPRLVRLSNSPSPSSSPASQLKKKAGSGHRGTIGNGLTQECAFEFEFEFEFAPLEVTRLSSPDTQIRTLFQLWENVQQTSSYNFPSNAHSKTKRSKVERLVSLPLFYDSRGDFGRLAAGLRAKLSGVDVPSCWTEDGYDHLDYTSKLNNRSPRKRQKIRAEGTGKEQDTNSETACSHDGDSPVGTNGDLRRSGLNLLTPQKYFNRVKQQPSPILVEFRTDIFSAEGREAIWRDSKLNMGESTPRFRTRTLSSTRSVVRTRDGCISDAQTHSAHMGQSEDTVEDGDGAGDRECRFKREDSGETFATFGFDPPKQLDNDLGTASLLDVEDDAWSFTLSAYEDADTKGGQIGGKTKIRKDSFFAPSASTLDDPLNDTITSTDVDKLLQVTLGAGSAAQDEPGTRLGHGTITSFLPPHIRMMYALEHEIDSPMSDTIITPLPLRHSSGSNAKDRTSEKSDMESPLSCMGALESEGQGLENTSTPLTRTVRSKNNTTRARIPTIEKQLPSIPTTSPKTLHKPKSERVLTFTESGSKRSSGQKTPNTESTKREESGVGSKSAAEVDEVEAALQTIDNNMTVQLWVDQEGCRENRTTLKYIRSIRASTFRDREHKALLEAAAWCESPTRPECFQQTGCWEFGMDPKERDKWAFHHAALEGLPVLRRLTINGDDKHDFLPRGATLQIKEPGVYTICGVEDRGKAEWKFDYLVQSKVSPTSGEEIANERIIVPLAFYVSPNFFNPERALRTHLLNVFKKTLTPNIVSEKIRPPHIGRPPIVLPVPVPVPSFAPAPSPVKCPPPVSIATPLSATLAKSSNAGHMSADGEQLASQRFGGRKRAQTQSQTQLQPLSVPTPTSSQSHSRSVSRTIGAIAKSIAGIGGTTAASTPTQPHANLNTVHSPTLPPPASASNGGRPGSSSATTSTSGIHRFGTKAPTFGRSGSRGKAPASSTGESAVITPATEACTLTEEDKKEKGKGRRRAASLFSRSRPFTPPINITETHPVPSLALVFGQNTAPQGKATQTSDSVAWAATSTTLTVPFTSEASTTSLSLPLPAPPVIPPRSAKRSSATAMLHVPTGYRQLPTRDQCLTQIQPQTHPFLRPDSYNYTYNNGQIQLPAVSPTPSFATFSSGPSAASSPAPSPLLTPHLSRSVSTSSRPRPRPGPGSGTSSGVSDRQIERRYDDVGRTAASAGTIGMGVGIMGLGLGSGSMPPRRPEMRKRPSTAEPRLGMR